MMIVLKACFAFIFQTLSTDREVSFIGNLQNFGAGSFISGPGSNDIDLSNNQLMSTSNNQLSSSYVLDYEDSTAGAEDEGEDLHHNPIKINFGKIWKQF